MPTNAIRVGKGRLLTFCAIGEGEAVVLPFRETSLRAAIAVDILSCLPLCGRSAMRHCAHSLAWARCRLDACFAGGCVLEKTGRLESCKQSKMPLLGTIERSLLLYMPDVQRHLCRLETRPRSYLECAKLCCIELLIYLI